jgi:hypothetical protein
MRQPIAPHVGLWLVFAAGVVAAVAGVALLLLSHDPDISAAEAAGGFALVAWVIFHPARAPETL